MPKLAVPKISTFYSSVLVCGLLAVCLFALTGSGAPLTNVITGQTMGTSYRIVLADSQDATTLAAMQAGHRPGFEPARRPDVYLAARFRTVPLQRFHFDRLVSQFSRDTVFVVSEAKRIWQLSDGAFDPTVAPLIKLWHFAEEPGEQSLPSESDIKQALAAIGFDQINVRLDPPSLMKKRPEIQLNLSAIAKGYAVDVVSKLLTERLAEDHLPTAHLVEIGGEMRGRGTKT